MVLPALRAQRGRRAVVHPAADVRADQEPPAGPQALHRGAGQPGRPVDRGRRAVAGGVPPAAPAGLRRHPRRGGPPGRQGRAAAAGPDGHRPGRRHRRGPDHPRPAPGQADDGPDGFNVHPKLARWLEQRAGALERNAVDWALGEALALGSLTEGRTIRLSGQDTRRGTFSQRHSVLVDQRTGELYTPLANLGEGQGKFFVYDSLLSSSRPWASSTATRWPTPRRWCCGRPSSATSSTAPRSSSTSSSRPPRTSGASAPAWSCCSPTGSRARGPSTPAPAWSASSTSPPRTTCRSPTPPPRPSTSTCCAARPCGPTASRWW